MAHAEGRGGLRRLASETAVYGFADAVGKGLSLILFPIFTRIFSPSEYGIIELIGTVTFLVSSMLILGLDSATSRYYFAEEDPERKGTVLGTALMFSAVVYVGGVLPLIVFHRSLGRAVLGTSGYSTAFLLALCAIPLSLFTSFHLNTLRRLLRPWWFAGLSTLSLSITITLNLLFVWRLRWGVQGTYAATLISTGITAVAGMWWTRRAYRWRWDGALIAKLLRFGVPLVPASLCLWGLSLLDRLFLVRLTTLNEVGLYSTANRLSSALGFAVGAFQMAWGPFAFSISNSAEARSVYARTLTYYLACGGFLVLGLSLFAPEALWILTPANYHRAAIAVAPLACGALAYGAYTLVSIGVNLANRTSQISLTLFWAALLNLLLCVVLIPLLGMLGAALATASGWIAAAVLLCVASQRAYPIPYEWVRVSWLALLLVGCLTLGLVSAGVGEPTGPRVALKILVCGVYLLGVKLLGLVPPLPASWRPRWGKAAVR